MAITRRTVVAAALMACALGRAHAQAFPQRPVRVVVPFGPGSSPDIIARLWGERLARAIGQPVVIENRAGASTILGAQAVATARADGHTLLYTVNNTLSINPFVYTRLPYRREDFAPVFRVLSVPYVLVVPASAPHRTLAELMAAARAAPNQLSYGSYGVAQGTHVALARLLNEAGVQMTHVPYRADAMNDLIAGRIATLFEPTTTAIPQITAGTVRALAVSGPTRVEVLPDVPTAAETFPGFVGDSWHGLLAPAGTPAEAIALIAAQSQRILDEPDFRATLRGHGLMPAGGSPDDFAWFLAADAEAWARVVRENDIRVE
jgi:tripartite-type tricarboxylate transporter receptor subunit TctC